MVEGYRLAYVWHHPPIWARFCEPCQDQAVHCLLVTTLSCLCVDGVALVLHAVKHRKAEVGSLRHLQLNRMHFRKSDCPLMPLCASQQLFALCCWKAIPPPWVFGNDEFAQHSCIVTCMLCIYFVYVLVYVQNNILCVCTCVVYILFDTKYTVKCNSETGSSRQVE